MVAIGGRQMKFGNHVHRRVPRRTRLANYVLEKYINSKPASMNSYFPNKNIAESTFVSQHRYDGSFAGFLFWRFSTDSDFIDFAGAEYFEAHCVWTNSQLASEGKYIKALQFV